MQKTHYLLFTVYALISLYPLNFTISSTADLFYSSEFLTLVSEIFNLLNSPFPLMVSRYFCRGWRGESG